MLPRPVINSSYAADAFSYDDSRGDLEAFLAPLAALRDEKVENVTERPGGGGIVAELAAQNEEIARELNLGEVGDGGEKCQFVKTDCVAVNDTQRFGGFRYADESTVANSDEPSELTPDNATRVFSVPNLGGGEETPQPAAKKRAKSKPAEELPATTTTGSDAGGELAIGDVVEYDTKGGFEQGKIEEIFTAVPSNERMANLSNGRSVKLSKLRRASSKAPEAPDEPKCRLCGEPLVERMDREFGIHSKECRPAETEQLRREKGTHPDAQNVIVGKTSISTYDPRITATDRADGAVQAGRFLWANRGDAARFLAAVDDAHGAGTDPFGISPDFDPNRYVASLEPEPFNLRRARGGERCSICTKEIPADGPILEVDVAGVKSDVGPCCRHLYEG